MQEGSLRGTVAEIGRSAQDFVRPELLLGNAVARPLEEGSHASSGGFALEKESGHFGLGNARIVILRPRIPLIERHSVPVRDVDGAEVTHVQTSNAAEVRRWWLTDVSPQHYIHLLTGWRQPFKT